MHLCHKILNETSIIKKSNLCEFLGHSWLQNWASNFLLDSPAPLILNSHFFPKKVQFETLKKQNSLLKSILPFSGNIQFAECDHPNEAKLLHGLCHIEYCAIIAYTATLVQFHGQYDAEFFEDLTGIIGDEGRHCEQISSFLKKVYDIEYGDLPVHSAILDGLNSTIHSLPERILVKYSKIAN